MSRKKHLDSDTIIRLAKDIAMEYMNQGLNLTLRQMYYQFVSRGHTGSGQDVYRKIGNTLTEARFDGRFPIKWLEDRGRNVEKGAFSPGNIDVSRADRACQQAVREFPEQYIWRGRWYEQPNHVTVLFEKEALAGVFGPTCDELGVGYFACKGYPSVSSIHEWMLHASEALRHGGARRCTILYLGDHDPDGFGITESLRDGIGKLQALGGYGPANYCDITVDRIALSMEQIQSFDPPPFDAKETSPRFNRYVEEQNTYDAWELDALEPTALRDLVREQVEALFDEDTHAEHQRTIDAARDELKDVLLREGWMVDTWEDA